MNELQRTNELRQSISPVRDDDPRLVINPSPMPDGSPKGAMVYDPDAPQPTTEPEAIPYAPSRPSDQAESENIEQVEIASAALKPLGYIATTKGDMQRADDDTNKSAPSDIETAPAGDESSTEERPGDEVPSEPTPADAGAGSGGGEDMPRTMRDDNEPERPEEPGPGDKPIDDTGITPAPADATHEEMDDPQQASQEVRDSDEPEELTAASAHEQELRRQADARAEVIAETLEILNVESPEEIPDVPTTLVDSKRDALSVDLIVDESPPRYVVRLEKERLADTSPESSSKVAQLGRGILQKIGLHDPEDPVRLIAEELEASRQMIREHVLVGVDDITVDTSLGLRTDESILPQSVRDIHHQAEEEAGREISFLTWMADYASDKQLLDVWQWHDDYLRKLDTDPTFLEQASRVRTGYLQGIEAAVQAGEVHPSIRASAEAVARAAIVHGSPLSPAMAGSDAYANKDHGVIQIQEGIADYTYYHEFAHLDGGIAVMFGEGATDLIATTVYNHAHEPSEHIDPRDLVYRDEVETLASIERMSEGAIGLYGLSEFYAGRSTMVNTVALMTYIDKEVGLPLSVPLLGLQEHLRESLEDQISNPKTVRLLLRVAVRQQVEFLEESLLDDTGRRILQTLDELTTRMTTIGNEGRYPPGLIRTGLSLVSHARDMAEEEDWKYY